MKLPDSEPQNDAQIDAEATALPMIPVTILSGFLGAGKTTLLKFILSTFHGKRIAVIENEFGEEIGVESLVAKDGVSGDVMDDFYELNNGCVCCTVRDDLVNTLERLLERRNRFDYIIVETTGMADPGKVASIFWVDDELEGRIYLDGIVTLVDSPRLDFHLKHADTQRETAAQLAYADRILLNKVDLIPDDEQRAVIVRKVTEINGLATIKWTEKSRVDLADILDIKSFTTSRAEQVEKELRTFMNNNIENESLKVYNNNQLIHTSGMQTICVRIRVGPLDQDYLERWLGELLWEQEYEDIGTETALGTTAISRQKLFRIKGVVAIVGKANKFILQAVHELFEVYASDECWTENSLMGDTNRVTQVVFIGLHLCKDELESGLRRCVVADATNL
ncbi:hypothetical protein CCR75_008254 [Bremia lactucae]|uniref:CobW C-terminal domain-containing protein n=1 Tax=Bremia lactucae TaxID=4779 RepID=A0A976FS04_BRELC|nr:hypothetical protein CCR75_008254 [Bremia lactucae]